MPARRDPCLLANGFLVECLTCSRSFLGAACPGGHWPEGDDDLVNQVFVVFTAEHGLRGVELGRRLALSFRSSSCISSLQASVWPLTAGRTVTKPPADRERRP